MKVVGVLLVLAAGIGLGSAEGNEGMIELSGGQFMMGADTHVENSRDREGPAKPAQIKPFAIDPTPVTNQMFRQFVRKTKYRTEAEDYGWSFVLDLLASTAIRNDKETQKLPNAEHWLAVVGAWWRQPEGPDSTIKGREEHPVVHVSHKDAVAYCAHVNKRLPTETEWECAARGGLESDYPWGAEAQHEGKHMMNVWQGEFPNRNTEADGYIGTAPVDAYPANQYGMQSALGNVWEWTATVYSHNSGFRCARDGTEGAPLSDDPRQKRAGGLPAGMDQEMLQNIAAEHGVEGLQKYLAESGSGAQVMTPGQLKERQAQLKKMKADMEAGREL